MNEKEIIELFLEHFTPQTFDNEDDMFQYAVNSFVESAEIIGSKYPQLTDINDENDSGCEWYDEFQENIIQKYLEIMDK